MSYFSDIKRKVSNKVFKLSSVYFLIMWNCAASYKFGARRQSNCLFAFTVFVWLKYCHATCLEYIDWSTKRYCLRLLNDKRIAWLQRYNLLSVVFLKRSITAKIVHFQNCFLFLMLSDRFFHIFIPHDFIVAFKIRCIHFIKQS